MKHMAQGLQQLYDACKDNFVKGAAPGEVVPQDRLQAVKPFLDAMTISDLGLSEEMLAQEDEGGTVSYRHICDCGRFSMGIFYLPPAAAIPLHNHPGMTVMSKLLYGSMHVKSFDWAEPFVQWPASGAPKARLANPVVDQVFTAPCEAFILYPSSGGNIHALTGVTGCAVLDILVPPYSIAEGRPCTYFQQVSYSVDSDAVNEASTIQRHAWLKIFQPPPDLVTSVPYECPPIVI